MNIDKNTSIGWVGTGVMGASMVGHLNKAGYKCIAFNRTKEKAAPLFDQGIDWADSPGEVAAQTAASYCQRHPYRHRP